VKKVYFSNIHIKNFLSVGEPGIDLTFNSGINLITGENRDKGGRNGVGKSTIVESLFWCLFGSTMRDIKKDKVIHNQVKKGCEVVLHFNIEDGVNKTLYKLTRTLEPSKILLQKYGESSLEDISLSSMPKTDEYIKELIGANEEVFQNAVIMTANNTTPFMAQKKIDKRKFVEGILNLGIFGQMLLQARSDYNEVKRDNDLTASKFIDQQKNLRLYVDQVEKNEENKKNKILQLKEKIDNNLQKIKNTLGGDLLDVKITNIDSDINLKEKDLRDLEEGLKKVKELIFNVNSSVLQTRYEINQLEKQKIDLQKGMACPTCKRKYDESINLEESLRGIDIDLSPLTEKIEPLSRDLKNYIDKESKITSALSSTKLKIKNLEKEKNDLKMASQELNQISQRNEEISIEIKDLRNERDGVLDLINGIEIEIKESESKIEDIQKRMTILDSAKFVVSEEGVKTYIIKKMLSLLNSRLNYYLQTLEAPCKCEFNEMFEEVIHNDSGKECSYFNFSGGERLRINLAVLFMFQDLLRIQTGSSFSLSMYDELFDSAVDEKGIEKVLEILKDRVSEYNESIYIVSHNTHIYKNSNIDNCIFLEKYKGVTSIKKL
jgi:DNA repair exonuclease SbcCD ATPase subunit